MLLNEETAYRVGGIRSVPPLNKRQTSIMPAFINNLQGFKRTDVSSLCETFFFDRLWYSNVVYQSRNYADSKVRDSSCVVYRANARDARAGNRYGRIIQFLQFKCKGRILYAAEIEQFAQVAQHIFTVPVVARKENHTLINLDQLIAKAIFVYLSPADHPNLKESFAVIQLIL